MRLLKKLVFLKKSKDIKPSKKDVNIRNRSTLFFQLGLIISTLVVILIINGNYEVIEKKAIAEPFEPEEEFYINDIVIIVPVSTEEVEEEKKVVKKKIITDVIELIDDSETKKTEEPVDTNPPVVVVPDDKKPTINPIPKAETGPVSIIGVERVPVFPGCEYLTDNTERRNCMSSEIGKLVNDRFDKKLASELGLNGQQRIYVTFSINKQGEVSKIEVRAPHPRLANEARRVVNSIPKMIPGMQSNQAVEVLYSLPIIFNVVN